MGSAVLMVRSGDFPVKPGAEHVCKVGAKERRVAADGAGLLSVPLELEGEVRISITPPAKR